MKSAYFPNLISPHHQFYMHGSEINICLSCRPASNPSANLALTTIRPFPPSIKDFGQSRQQRYSLGSITFTWLLWEHLLWSLSFFCPLSSRLHTVVNKITSVLGFPTLIRKPKSLWGNRAPHIFVPWFSPSFSPLLYGQIGFPDSPLTWPLHVPVPFTKNPLPAFPLECKHQAAGYVHLFTSPYRDTIFIEHTVVAQ